MAATAFLFDLDGTLCDSRSWYVRVFADGHGADRALVASRLAEGYPPVLLADALHISRARLLRTCVEAAEALQLYPGVHQTLEALVRRGTPLGLATGGAGKFARLVLDRHDLADFFGAIVTPGWGTPAKPHPALLNQALTAMGLTASGAIYYVGDTANDGGAAQAAGLSFAWASYGYGDQCPRLATAVLREFGDVCAL